MKKVWEKILRKNFWLTIFYGCKMISWIKGLDEKKFEKKLLWEIFWWIICYGCKIISAKQLWKKDFLRKII